MIYIYYGTVLSSLTNCSQILDSLLDIDTEAADADAESQGNAAEDYCPTV